MTLQQRVRDKLTQVWWARRPVCAPVQRAPMGGAGPGATPGRGRGSCTCLGSAARVAACWGWALLPRGQGYVQIVPVLMDPRGMSTRWMSRTAGLP